MKRELVEVNPETWTPEKEDDFVEGYLVLKETEKGNYDSNAYHLRDDEDKAHFVWGSTVLDTRMATVKIGQWVKITYKGKETTSTGRPVNIYKVEKEKSPDIVVGAEEVV